MFVSRDEREKQDFSQAHLSDETRASLLQKYTSSFETCPPESPTELGL